MAFNILSRVASRLKGEKILYFPGCLTQLKYPKWVQNYKSMLNDAGVPYVMINGLKCCGSPLLNAGYVEDFKKLKAENEEILKKNGITRIITNCPHCLKAFRKGYGLEAEHISQILDARKYSAEKENGEVTYHSPCILEKEGITQEPRSLLKRKGFEIREPARQLCCGVCGGVKQNNPELANKIAQRALHQLKAETIVVSCPYCYSHLSENVGRGSSRKLLELSEAIFDE